MGVSCSVEYQVCSTGENGDFYLYKKRRNGINNQPLSNMDEKNKFVTPFDVNPELELNVQNLPNKDFLNININNSDIIDLDDKKNQQKRQQQQQVKYYSIVDELLNNNNNNNDDNLLSPSLTETNNTKTPTTTATTTITKQSYSNYLSDPNHLQNLSNSSIFTSDDDIDKEKRKKEEEEEEREEREEETDNENENQCDREKPVNINDFKRKSLIREKSAWKWKETEMDKLHEDMEKELLKLQYKNQ